MAKHTRKDKIGRVPCFVCGKIKTIDCYALSKPPSIRDSVLFVNQSCDDCVTKARKRASQQVIDCSVEGDYLVKRIAPDMHCERFDLYAAWVPDVRTR